MRRLILLLALLIALPVAAKAPTLIGGSDCHRIDGVYQCGTWHGYDATGAPVPMTVQLAAYPLIVANEQAVIVGNSLTRQQQRELVKAVLPGVIDEGERKAIAALCGAAIGDGVSTIVGLTCAGVREANPLYGASPNPLAVIAVTWATCRWARWDAMQTHAYNSSAPYLTFVATLKGIATLNNFGVLKRAHGCL